jgi:DNA-binding NtrC family response regulator
LQQIRQPAERLGTITPITRFGWLGPADDGEAGLQARNVGTPDTEPEREQDVVLVVEDDIIERMWVSKCLRDAGYVVVEAGAVEDARKILQSGPEIHIVFADVILQHNSNIIDLVAWMETETPSVPVVLTSGQSRPLEALNVTSCANVTDFLPKPFLCDEVQRLLSQRLRSRRGPTSAEQ